MLVIVDFVVCVQTRIPDSEFISVQLLVSKLINESITRLIHQLGTHCRPIGGPILKEFWAMNPYLKEALIMTKCVFINLTVSDIFESCKRFWYLQRAQE